MPGDRQDVITRDNVVVTVNATIFTQVVDARQALFSVKNFDIAIDALARTALRSVIGTMTLDDALSERERINTDVQQQMEVVTDKWGIRISRIEIVEIAPPPQILQALALQKQADQEKRATILASEGRQSSAINVADGDAQAAVRAAEGERQAAILRAEGNRQAAILEAEGRAQAIATVYGAIKKAQPDPTLVAILQLDALGPLRRQRQRRRSSCPSRAPASSAPRRRCAACSTPRRPLPAADGRRRGLGRAERRGSSDRTVPEEQLSGRSVFRGLLHHRLRLEAGVLQQPEPDISPEQPPPVPIVYDLYGAVRLPAARRRSP